MLIAATIRANAALLSTQKLLSWTSRLGCSWFGSQGRPVLLLALVRYRPISVERSYLEVCADIPQLPLEEQENVFVVFTLLIWFRVHTLGERLETPNLLVQGRQILFDDEGQLYRVSLQGSIEVCSRKAAGPGRTSLISTGLSSNSVFFLATAKCSVSFHNTIAKDGGPYIEPTFPTSPSCPKYPSRYLPPASRTLIAAVVHRRCSGRR